MSLSRPNSSVSSKTATTDRSPNSLRPPMELFGTLPSVLVNDVINFRFSDIPNTNLYFSYASMILPSNNAFVANGNPTAHLVVSKNGRSRRRTIIQVPGSGVLDGGSEVNDEIPIKTAFFGQEVPDTGVVEGGVVTVHPGFNARGSGGILDAAQFRNADFTARRYRALDSGVFIF